MCTQYHFTTQIPVVSSLVGVGCSGDDLVPHLGGGVSGDRVGEAGTLSGGEVRMERLEVSLSRESEQALDEERCWFSMASRLLG